MKIRIIAKRLLLWLLLLAIAAAIFALLCGIQTVYVKSESMEPAISVGSLCLVDTKTERNALRPGDIIVFSVGEMDIAHRIIRETKQGFHTKGDANDSPDSGIVFPEKVKGKVIITFPYIGYAACLCQSPISFLIACIVLFSLAECSEKKHCHGYFARNPKRRTDR